VLAYFVAFLLRAVRETASRSRAAPDLPPIADPQNIVNLLKFLLLCLIYIGPIFTIPLVPLGLLGLAAPGTVSPFNLRGMSGVLGRHAKDFVILWLLLLLWGAALVLALALLAVARILVGDWMPHLQGSSLTALEFVGLAVGSFVTAGLVSIFGLCLCRCVGMFGRHNANILTPARDAKQNPSPNPPGPLQSSV